MRHQTNAPFLSAAMPLIQTRIWTTSTRLFSTRTISTWPTVATRRTLSGKRKRRRTRVGGGTGEDAMNWIITTAVSEHAILPAIATEVVTGVMIGVGTGAVTEVGTGVVIEAAIEVETGVVIGVVTGAE